VPLNIIIQKINQALTDLGPMPYTDTSSITIAANQTEYSLPIAANRDLRQVWLQMEKDDADDNLWIEIFNWEVEKSATGTADTLILPAQYATGYDLKLVYVAVHPDLFVSTSQLSEHVPIERVVYAAALGCWMWRKQRNRTREFDDDIERYEAKAEQMRMNYPIKAPSKPGRLMIVGDERLNYEDEPNKVYL